MIEVKKLSKQFGSTTAVNQISFSAKSGEVICLLGPNGAGKSTTMRMLTGYLKPTSGKVLIGSSDMTTHPIEARKNIGYLPEGAPSYGEMTGYEFLHFMALIREIKNDEAHQKILNISEILDIKHILQKTIHTLSKGYRQRLGIAQAIIHDPHVLILDEPSDGLDPNQKMMIRDLIRDMGSGKSILFSTHILEEAEAVATRVIVINEGEILCDSSISDIQNSGGLENTYKTLTAKATSHAAQWGKQ